MGPALRLHRHDPPSGTEPAATPPVSCTVHSSGLSCDWNEDTSAHALYRAAFTLEAWILQQDSAGLLNCPELLLRLKEGRKWERKLSHVCIAFELRNRIRLLYHQLSSLPA